MFEIKLGAGNESRTRDLNLGKVALYQLSYSRVDMFEIKLGAGNESRTRDLNLGKVALYQLSYSRNDMFEIKLGAGNESRTRDLNLGKVALYQLSYSRPISFSNIEETQLLWILFLPSSYFYVFFRRFLSTPFSDNTASTRLSAKMR